MAADWGRRPGVRSCELRRTFWRLVVRLVESRIQRHSARTRPHGRCPIRMMCRNDWLVAWLLQRYRHERQFIAALRAFCGFFHDPGGSLADILAMMPINYVADKFGNHRLAPTVGTEFVGTARTFESQRAEAHNLQEGFFCHCQQHGTIGLPISRGAKFKLHHYPSAMVGYSSAPLDNCNCERHYSFRLISFCCGLNATLGTSGSRNDPLWPKIGLRTNEKHQHCLTPIGQGADSLRG